MQPVFLEGNNIILSTLSEEDNLGGYVNWLNDQKTTTFMGSGRFPVTAKSLRVYIDHYNDSKDGMLLGIFIKRASRHIGNITLHQIDFRNRFAEIGIIIGDKKSYGKGYATKAIRLVVEHAFSRLNLRKLYTGMVKGNEGSKKAFEKVGFKVEGVLKEHFYLNGEYLDYYKLGLLKGEFKSKQ
jgi:RimJ/RimL family protein N-acetyltransferase